MYSCSAPVNLSLINTQFNTRGEGDQYTVSIDPRLTVTIFRIETS